MSVRTSKPYNAAQRTRAGQVMTATLDARHRETAQTWSGGAPNVARSFDAIGRLLSSSNGNTATSYSYNVANEKLTETQATAGAPAAWTLTYAHNADGLRQSVTYPGGDVIATTYTARNEVESISAGGPPPLATYSYNLDGTLAQKVLENGTAAAYGYDVANQLLNITQALGATAFAQRDYTYNSRGLRTAMQVNAGTWDVYGYDLTDQVTSVKYSAAASTGTTPASTLTYTYDAVGNRTQVKHTATGVTAVTNNYTTANSVNQYPAVNSGSVAYDTNGNLTSAPAGFLNQSSAQSASYDGLNRLLSITTDSGTVSQVYDTKNRVVSRTINGTTTYFVWDGWNLIEERDASGNELRSYVHGAAVDEILAMIDSSGAHYHHHDALGNVIALTNASGTLEETYRYDAFGKATATNASTSATADTSFFGNRFLYTGREWIAEAGLYDYRNRVYSAALGRFMQTDPILFAAGDVNLYRYVGNGVIVYFDPDGLKDQPKLSPEAPRRKHPGTETPPPNPSKLDNPKDNTSYNCHSHAWHGGAGDPTDPGNTGLPKKWDNSPEDDMKGATKLAPNDPNKPGDKVVYGNDTNKDGKLTGTEIQHSAKVTSVDKDGNTTRVEGKEGFSEITDHHPRDANPKYGNIREYYRP